MKKTHLLIPLLLTVLLCACSNSLAEKNNDQSTQLDHTASTKQPPNMANKIIDTFEEKFGVHEGKRRNHIDGFCFSGHLTLRDPRIKEYTKSVLFSGEPLEVTGRFSHKGGVKKDESQPGEYGMAFQVQLENNGAHNFSMNTLDFFPVNTPEGFLQLMQAKVSGKAEDFSQLKKNHPEFATFKAHYGAKPKGELKSYANHQFNSVNTFLLESESGKTTPVRWSFVPKNPFVSLNEIEDINYFDITKQQLEAGALQWDMVVYIANETDEIHKAAVPWTGEHEHFVAAVLTVTDVMATGSCEDINFNPLVLSEGILPSDDPVLKFRSPAYASSFARRMKEKKEKKECPF